MRFEFPSRTPGDAPDDTDSTSGDRHERGGGPAFGRIDAYVVLAGTAAVVLVLLFHRSLEQFGDSLSYATEARAGSPLFHPHHLLFFPILRATHFLLSSLHASADVILAAQLHNAFWAAVTVASMYWTVASLTASRLLAAAVAAAILGSYTFLVFASQVEVYVPAMGCLAACVAVLTARTRQTTRTLALATTLLSLAVFYHQTSVVVCPALLVYLGWRDGARGWRDGLLLIASAGAIVLAAYVGAFAASPRARSTRGFVSFCLRYAVANNPEWGRMSNFGLAGVQAMIASQWECIVGPSLQKGRSASVVFAFLVGAAGLWNLHRMFRDPDPATRGARALVAVWLPAHFLFFLWWLPTQRSFFLASLVPLGLLASLCLSDCLRVIRRRDLRSGISIILLLVAVAWLLPRNVASGLDPRHASHGPLYDEAAAYLHGVPAGSVHFASNRRLARTMVYYWNLEDDHVQNLHQRRWYFTHRGGTHLPPLPPRECVVVPLRSLLSGVDRQQTALEWSRFLKWMFRVEENGTTGELSAPPVRRLVHPNGQEYLLSEGAPVDCGDLRSFCRRLDEVGAPLAPTPGMLEQWYLAHRDVLSGADSRADGRHGRPDRR